MQGQIDDLNSTLNKTTAQLRGEISDRDEQIRRLKAQISDLEKQHN